MLVAKARAHTSTGNAQPRQTTTSVLRWQSTPDYLPDPRKMAAPAFALLDPAQEDALHYSRLLTVEERPFLRLVNRLQMTQPSVINTFPRQLPSPPPEGAEGDIAIDDEADEGADPAAAFDYKKQDIERQQWRQELLLEFATIENTLARIQLLCDSNERERARYAEQKTKILESAQAVRTNTAELRVQLREAQQTLALRKEYDALADTITANKALRPRDEQNAAMDKLRNEIADLEHEGAEFGTTWQERRALFTRVMDESRQMVNVIKGIKDFVDDEDAGQGGEVLQDESTSVGEDETQSRQATPGAADAQGSQTQGGTATPAQAQSPSTKDNPTSTLASDTQMDEGAEPKDNGGSEDAGLVTEEMDTT